MPFYSSSIRRILDKWPGKQRFGVYRFLPLFFILGATLEFSMINWTVGETNFYNTFKNVKLKISLKENCKRQCNHQQKKQRSYNLVNSKISQRKLN